MRLSISDLSRRVGSAFQTILRSNICRAAASIVFLVIILGSIILWQYWISLIKDAQSRGSTLAYLLAEQTTRTFQAADLTLSGLDAALNAVPLPAHSSSFETLLAQRVAELDFIHAIFVVDPAGRVLQSSGAAQEAVPTGAARRYFETFARDPKRNFLIGQPLFNHPGMLSAIPVFRRLESADGGVGGMIVATVDPKYFRDFYRAVDLGRRGSIDLYQDNGSILLASTGTSATTFMPSLPTAAPMFDVESRLGLVRPSSTAASDRLVAYHRAQGYPLVVAVGISQKDIATRWWRIAGPTLAAMTAAVLMGIALAVLIVRRLEERQRAQTRAMAMQKLEALGQMTASVSHDFRNLLTVMRATLRLVRKQGPTEKILSAAEEVIDRGSGLVTQLLAFSRRHMLEVQPADINALLSGLTQVLEHAAGREVALRIDKAPDLPLCKADQTQFDATMMNLVINARQAMPRGGPLSISTALAKDMAGGGPGFVELKVADSGIGIAPGDLKRIFEPFFTTKADTGTGLGLSQVHTFMRQIGGDVTVSSVVETGTTFTLLFPVVGVDGAAMVESVNSRAASRREETMATPE